MIERAYCAQYDGDCIADRHAVPMCVVKDMDAVGVCQAVQALKR